MVNSLIVEQIELLTEERLVISSRLDCIEPQSDIWFDIMEQLTVIDKEIMDLNDLLI